VRSSTAVLIKGFRIIPYGNNIEAGIDIEPSSQNCAVVGNTIAGFSLGSGFDRNFYGIVLGGYDHKIYENIIVRNLYGISSYSTCDNSRIYHNTFTDNTFHASIYYLANNQWDNGYPSGGNHWSDYKGTDLYRGTVQNETGSDGIGDKPYIVDGDEIDRYPLMKPYAGPHDIVMRPSISKTVVGEGLNITATINMTIINYGEQTETCNFSIRIDAMTDNQTLTLTSRNSTVQTYAFNTSSLPKRGYVVAAQVEPVPGETSLEDNSFTCNITVTIPGDVDGDFDVDIFDVVSICTVYSSKKGEARYVSNCDINDDEKIDIYDVVIACANYGQKYSSSSLFSSMTHATEGQFVLRSNPRHMAKSECYMRLEC